MFSKLKLIGTTLIPKTASWGLRLPSILSATVLGTNASGDIVASSLGSKETIICNLNSSNSANLQYSITTSDQILALTLVSKTSAFTVASNRITCTKTGTYTIELSINIAATSSTSRVIDVLVNKYGGAAIKRVSFTSPGGSSTNPGNMHVSLKGVSITANDVVELMIKGGSSYTLDVSPNTYLSQIAIYEE
jgi:hypothetical protein